jgi:hypothetical protein
MRKGEALMTPSTKTVGAFWATAGGLLAIAWAQIPASTPQRDAVADGQRPSAVKAVGPEQQKNAHDNSDVFRPVSADGIRESGSMSVATSSRRGDVARLLHPRNRVQPRHMAENYIPLDDMIESLVPDGLRQKREKSSGILPSAEGWPHGRSADPTIGKSLAKSFNLRALARNAPERHASTTCVLDDHHLRNVHFLRRAGFTTRSVFSSASHVPASYLHAFTG